MQTDKQLLKFALKSAGTPFRGDIIENAKQFRLIGKAYDSLPKEQDGFFDISSARHLAGPLAALFDSGVREIGNIGASQVLKSVGGDSWTPFVCEHVCRNMLILFEDDPKAQTFWETRLEWTIKKHPSLSKFIQTAGRFAATTKGIKFPNGMRLEIGGLNDGNVSSLSWPIIWISEAWQHKSDGLLKKARERADRFPNDKKIYCESRAGMAGEDLHRYTEEMVRCDCVWRCPYCDGPNIWDFQQLRPDDFKQRDALKIQPGIEVKEIIKPHSYGGMFIPEDGTIEERARAAVWKCFWCDSRIEDGRTMRQKLMDTYEQNYKVNGIAPKKVCFFLPKECARDNTFEASALSYLTAQSALASGNETPIADWYMSERAVFFERKLIAPSVITPVGNYDPHKQIENEDHRGMEIDCQKDLKLDTVGTFWAEAYAADKNGNSFQLERGFFTSWEALLEMQKRWKIENRFVAIDGRKWTPEILRRCAMYRQLEKGINQMTRREVTYWRCWTVLLGDDARSFPWYIAQRREHRVYSQPTIRYETVINAQNKSERVQISLVRWSNPSIKDQLHNLLLGSQGLPKFQSLSRDQISEALRIKESGNLAYDKQMNSETPVEKNGRRTWEKITTSSQNHYWDLACMRLVQLARRGLAGHVGVAE